MKTNGLKKLALLLALALMITVFAACSKTENQDKVDGEPAQDEKSVQDKESVEDEKSTQKEGDAFPVQITDVLGRTIEVEKEPERIVSITPSSTETLFALGLGDKIVAVSNQCDYPEEAQSKDKVGDFWQPNLEQIAAAEPDLLFVGNSIPNDVLSKLEELGIKVVSLEATDFAGTYQSILDTGKLTGTLEEAQNIVNEMKEKVNGIQEKVKDAPKRSTYFVISYGDQGNYTAGPGSFIHEMITMAGGQNVAGDLEQTWAEFSLEKLVEEDPEVIIVSEKANIDDIKALKGYKELTAVKEDNLKAVEENLVMRPGPRLVEGLEQIAEAIHPEIFK